MTAPLLHFPTTDLRIVLCEACGSEGRILTSNGGPYDTDHGECPYCQGTGSKVIEVQLINADDLDAMAGAAS